MAALHEIPLETLLGLRRMRPSDAERKLREFDLSDEDFAAGMELAGKDLISDDFSVSAMGAQQQEWAIKRLWRASAYLLGGSMRQIATLDNVAHTSVNDSLRRVLGEGRQAERLAKGIAHEHLSAHLRKFNSNVPSLKNKTPLEVAQWLQLNTDLD